MKLPILITAAAFAILSSQSLHAATITLNVAADTYIDDDNTTSNFGSSTQVIVGSSTAGDGRRHRGLIRFDTSGITIPVNNTINVTSVTMNTLNSSSSTGTGSVTVNVYDYAYDFNEALATWNNPDGASGGDTTAGGTVGTLLTSLSVDEASGAANSFSTSSAFTSAVQSAILGDDTVNLLLLRTAHSDANNYIRFLGLEDLDSNVGFQLDITYEFVPVPEPKAALLGGLGMLALLRRRR